MSVTVVIPVYNGAATILRTIECLREQSLKPHEIIVVDDGSTDDTPELLRKLDGEITYLQKANGGPASARNQGIRAANTDFIAFTDSDCMPDRDWLLNLRNGFDDPQVGGVGGIVRSADRNATGQYVDEVRLLDPAPDDSGQIPYLITANACFRRKAIVDAGFFDERFRKPGGEEPELCLRIRKLGYRFKMTETAVVLHHHRQTTRSLLKTIANYGEGLYLLGQSWPDYRIEKPSRMLLRRLISLRAFFRRIPAYSRRYGVGKAVYFSLLDYLRQLAFLSGYLRAEKREA